MHSLRIQRRFPLLPASIAPTNAGRVYNAPSCNHCLDNFRIWEGRCYRKSPLELVRIVHFQRSYECKTDWRAALSVSLDPLHRPVKHATFVWNHQQEVSTLPLSRSQLIAMSHIRRKQLLASYRYLQPPHQSNERVECLSEAKYQDWSITAKSKPLRNNGRKAFACIVDGICMLVCVATFAFAMLVYRADNTMMDSYHWRLFDASKIVSIHCAFPSLS